MSPLSDDICEQHVHDRNIKRGTTCKDHMPISYLVICRHLIHRSAYYHPLFYVLLRNHVFIFLLFIIIVSYTPFVN